MLSLCLVATSLASPPALEQDGLELSRSRWLDGVGVVFRGQVVERPEPLWLVDGLFGTDSVGALVEPRRIERARLRVDEVWSGAILEANVELWENERSAGVVDPQVGDEVIVLGGLWDLRSIFGSHASDLGDPSYAAESVYAHAWRVMRVRDGRVWTWTRGVPVCPSLQADELLVPCEGDEGARVADVAAALSGALPDGGATLPGVP